MFAANDDVILVTSYQIGSTGIDINRIFNLFLIDAGTGFIKVIQSIGRGLRKAIDKDTIWVYDIGSDLKSSRKHCNNRKKHYEKEKYEFTYQKVDYLINDT
jgi:superfamily II DNA or RNA helicase